MLWQRVLTGVPLALLIIWVILFQPGEVFRWVSLLIAALATWEWAQLSGADNRLLKIVYAAVISLMCWLLATRLPQYASWFIHAAVIWWTGVAVYLFYARPENGTDALSILKLLAGLLVIPAAVLAMIQMHAAQQGQWLMYGLMLVWVADSGAYFSGRRFGRHKLAYRISPGKTLEGLFGAVVTVVIYTLIAAWYFELGSGRTLLLILLAIVLTLVSVVGDLYESLLKREQGVKDSGAILPGHGGVLDRIDSVLAAMPVFAVGFTHVMQQGGAF
jgi:phosphatidate cytidylyltransferase